LWAWPWCTLVLTANLLFGLPVHCSLISPPLNTGHSHSYMYCPRMKCSNMVARQICCSVYSLCSVKLIFTVSVSVSLSVSLIVCVWLYNQDKAALGRFNCFYHWIEKSSLFKLLISNTTWRVMHCHLCWSIKCIAEIYLMIAAQGSEEGKKYFIHNHAHLVFIFNKCNICHDLKKKKSKSIFLKHILILLSTIQVCLYYCLIKIQLRFFICYFHQCYFDEFFTCKWNCWQDSTLHLNWNNPQGKGTTIEHMSETVHPVPHFFSSSAMVITLMLNLKWLPIINSNPRKQCFHDNERAAWVMSLGAVTHHLIVGE